MHADYHGAATTLIKNSFPGKPIPLMTLEEVILKNLSRRLVEQYVEVKHGIRRFLQKFTLAFNKLLVGICQLGV
jgi:hypothetical protein